MIHLFLAQQNYTIGHFESNTRKMVEAIRKAKDKNADLILFPELALGGYPPQDFLGFPEFLERSMACLDILAEEARGLAIIVGGPAENPLAKGKALHNAAYFLEEGKIKARIYKSLLPDYDVFDEYRHFEPGSAQEIVPFKGYKLGITICEDIWDRGSRSLYSRSPVRNLKEKGADLLINLSASPFDYLQGERRRQVLQDQARTHGLDIVYVNTVGAQTELIFDGGSQIFSSQGHALLSMPRFEESLQSFVWEPSAPRWPLTEEESEWEFPASRLDPEKGIPEIHQALILGIRDYFSKLGFTRALVASSGGIDSALTQTLATEAMGPQQVVALSLPSPYSSASSVEDARELSSRLGNPFEVLSIDSLFQEFLKTLEPVFGQLPQDITEENLQSRIRGSLAMAMANKMGYILLNTSNKSELATGYGTLYGDMAGGLSVIGDLYKVQVYALARYMNLRAPRIPESIIQKPPSAELRPGQLDLDSLPDYGILDPLLYQFIEGQKGPRDLSDQGFDPEMGERVLGMVHRSEYKRHQFCPILRISPRAFGKGRQVPIVSRLPW